MVNCNENQLTTLTAVVVFSQIEQDSVGCIVCSCFLFLQSGSDGTQSAVGSQILIQSQLVTLSAVRSFFDKSQFVDGK